MEKSDHDLLIEICRDMQWLKDSFLSHCESKAAALKDLDTKVTAAHKRIDWLQIGGIMSLVVLAVTIWLK